MKALLAIVFITVCVAKPALGEEYANPAYGITLRAEGDWKFERTAKLEVDLHDLSNEQLSELFHAYQGFGVVRMVKGDGNDRPWIMIQFATPRGEIKSALEKAEGFERGAKSRNEQVVVPATEKGLSGVPAAYLATRRTLAGKTLVFHQFIVRRARSYVVITCVLPLPGDNSDVRFDDLMDVLANVEIDVEADSRSTD